MPSGALIHLNCQSTLLMVYSAFEAFLRQFTEFIDDKAGVLKYPYDDQTIDQLNRYSGSSVAQRKKSVADHR